MKNQKLIFDNKDWIKKRLKLSFLQCLLTTEVDDDDKYHMKTWFESRVYKSPEIVNQKAMMLWLKGKNIKY